MLPDDGAGGDTACRCGKEGRDGGPHHDVVGGELGARVEAEPAEPQDEHAHDHEGDVVARDGSRLAVLVVLADARTEEVGAHERRPTTGAVHDGGSGEVGELGVADLQVGEQAFTTPERVHHDRVDDRGHHRREDQIATDLRALGHRSRSDRDGRCREHHLEEERRIAAVEPVEGAVAEPVEEEQIGAEEAAGVAAEGDAVADGPERQGAHRHVGQVLRHDVGHVLGSRETGLHEAETGLHEEHEDAGDEHPDVVEGGLHGFGGQFVLRDGRSGHAHDYGERSNGGYAELAFHVFLLVRPTNELDVAQGMSDAFLDCSTRVTRTERVADANLNDSTGPGPGPGLSRADSRGSAPFGS